jgi:hypothetical protein
MNRNYLNFIMPLEIKQSTIKPIMGSAIDLIENRKTPGSGGGLSVTNRTISLARIIGR